MERINVKTKGRTELIDITGEIQSVVSRGKVKSGCCVIFIPHTTAGLTINENADPSVKKDIQNIMNRLIPEAGPYSHAEGNSDAHIKSSLLGNSLTMLIEDSRLCLGTWQGIYFVEGDGPRQREVWVKII
jgi:secondary thiamine-phosphate synthase enzyme